MPADITPLWVGADQVPVSVPPGRATVAAGRGRLQPWRVMKPIPFTEPPSMPDRKVAPGIVTGRPRRRVLDAG